MIYCFRKTLAEAGNNISSNYVTRKHNALHIKFQWNSKRIFYIRK